MVILKFVLIYFMRHHAFYGNVNLKCYLEGKKGRKRERRRKNKRKEEINMGRKRES